MPLLFIDFEASSLDQDSWPIEIGFAWLESDEIRSIGKLIRPEPTWPQSTWSRASAAIHKIPRAALNDADPAADVAHWAIDLIGDQTLVSDAPAFDQYWLDRLLETAPGLPRPEIVDFDAVAGYRFRFPAIARVFARLDNSPTKHRAEADARKLAEAWQVGLASDARR